MRHPADPAEARAPLPATAQTNERLLDSLARIGARDVLDIGCGHGGLAAVLAGSGYRVTGVDPDPAAVARARERAPDARFEVAVAELLPFGRESFDAAVLVNALHHVPVSAMADALEEAQRVLRPGGALIVVEPLAEGSFFEVMRPVEDETALRAAARAALAAHAERHGSAVRQAVTYDRLSTFSDLDAFIDYLVAVDPGRRALAEARRTELQRLFDAQGRPGPDGRVLVQPLTLVELAAAPKPA